MGTLAQMTPLNPLDPLAAELRELEVRLDGEQRFRIAEALLVSALEEPSFLAGASAELVIGIELALESFAEARRGAE